MPVIGFHCSHEQISPARTSSGRPTRRSRPASPPACPLTTSVRGAHDRASQASPGRSSVLHWRRRRCHSAWSTRPGSATTPRSSPRPSRHWRRCFPGGSGRRSARARRPTNGLPARCGRARKCAIGASSSASRSSDACCKGEEVSHEGLIHVNRAQLWTLPETVPDLVGPAVSPETAARHAAWADGLITVNQPKRDAARGSDAYRGAGGRGPARLQIHLSWAPTDERGPGHRPRPVAQQRLRSSGVLGPRDRRGIRRRSARPSPPSG